MKRTKFIKHLNSYVRIHQAWCKTR